MGWLKALPTAAACMAGLLLLLWGRGAAADQIMLKNGDRITGTVVRMDQGVLTLKTDYAEKLEIDADAVQSLSTEEPVEVRLQGGELLRGRLRSEAGEFGIMAGDERGAAAVAWARIASINVPPPPPWSWAGNVFLGALKQSGNTDRLSASFGGEATRRSATDRFSLSLLYNYAEEDGALTTRDTYGTVKYDHFFTKKFYGYLGIEMLKDKFKDLNLRTIAGPGVGYQIRDDETLALALEAGVAYFSEDRIEADDDHWLTARLGARFRYTLGGQTTFTDNLALYPNLESGGEFTSRNEATLLTSIAGPWSLRLANVWEYDSDPAAGIKKSDTRSSVNLQYSF